MAELLAVIAVCCVPHILSFLGPQFDNDTWRRSCYDPVNVSLYQGFVMLCVLCGFVQRKHLNAKEREQELLSKENEGNKQTISELQQQVDALNETITPLRQQCDEFDHHISEWEYECRSVLQQQEHLYSILTTFVKHQLWVTHRDNDGVSAEAIVQNIIDCGQFKSDADVFLHYDALATRDL